MNYGQDRELAESTITKSFASDQVNSITPRFLGTTLFLEKARAVGICMLRWCRCLGV